jgi:hypothetical protein
MSSVSRLDTEKLRARRIIATATLTAVTVGFLLLKDTSAQASNTLPAAEPSHRTAEKQVRSDPGEKKMQTASTGRPVRPQEE